MAKPQIEHGYFKIANELAEALARTHLTGNEWQIVWAVMRRTYGWGKKSDRIANSQLSEDTRLSRRRVIEAVQSLTDKNILGRKGNGPRSPSTLWLNKDYESWTSPSAENRTRGKKGSAEIRTRKGSAPGKSGASSQPSAEIRTREGKIPLVRKTALDLVRKSALGNMVRKTAPGEGLIPCETGGNGDHPSKAPLVRKSAPTKDSTKDKYKYSTPSSSVVNYSGISEEGLPAQRKPDLSESHPELYETSRQFHIHQQTQHPTKIKSLPEKKIRDGANVLRLLTERDGYDLQREILPALKWAIRDEFWSYQLLSLSGLRKVGKNGEMKIVNIIASMERQRANPPKEKEEESKFEKLRAWKQRRAQEV